MAKNAGGKTRKVKLRAKITQVDLDTLVVTMCLNRTIRAQATRLITREHFLPGEASWALVVRVIGELLDEYADVDRIPYLDLKGAVNDAAHGIGSELRPEDWDAIFDTPEDGKDGVPGLLWTACKMYKPSDFTTEKARALLVRFLEERAVDAPIKHAAQFGSSVVVNWADHFDEHQRMVAKIRSMGESPFRDFGMSELEDTTVTTIPTTMAFVNDMMGGGFAAREIIGITAPTGGGKSTLVHQLGMSLARSFQIIAGPDAAADDLRSSLVFSYEDDEQRIFVRSMACAARIPRGVLQERRDTKTDLLRKRSDYDQKLAELEDIPIEEYPTEYARFRHAVKTFRKNYRYLDMTQPGRGDGGVAEIVGMIDADVATTGQRPGLVVVDSIDLLAENHLREIGEDPQRLLPTEIPAAVHRLRKLVGVKYGCTVIVTNQLAGQFLKQTSMNLDHSQAGGSKSWAKGLDYHFMLCKMTSEKVAALACTKDRRSGHDGDKVLIRMDGRFGRWLDASHTHVVQNGAIMSRSAAESVQGPISFKKMPATDADFDDDPEV